MLIGTKDKEDVASLYENTGSLSASVSEDLALEACTPTAGGVSF